MATTMSAYGAKINIPLCEFAGLSTDTKPIEKFQDSEMGLIYIFNGSKFYEIDTGKEYKYDAENKQWKEV